MDNLQDQIKLATLAAKKSGEYLQKLQHKPITSSIGKDIKLIADKQSEEIIINLLEKTNYSILSEEKGLCLKQDSKYIWIIDPIDGTYNYYRNLHDLFCVSIALFTDDLKPILGVIYNFSQDILYIGNVINKQATKNGVPINTSNIKNIEEVCLATGLPVTLMNSNNYINTMQTMFKIFQKVKKIRMLGSAALMGASLAHGSIDIYSEDKIMLWDIAASTALVIAAGGKYDLSIANNYTCNITLYANNELQIKYQNFLL